MKKSQLNVILTAGVVTLLLFSGCVSGIVSTFQSTTTDSSRQKNTVSNNDARITCYVGGILRTKTISYESGMYLNELFSALVQANANDPCGKGTQMLKVRFIELLANLGLLSHDLSVQDVCSLIEPPWLHSALSLRRSPLISPRLSDDEDNATLLFCSMAGAGWGFLIPPVLLPRPRVVMQWRGFYPDSSAVSVAEMATGRGVIARGTQVGTSFGFIGVGFAFALPGSPAQFGFLGYSLMTKIQAADMSWYYANFPPLVMGMSPEDGAVDVPVSLSELRFTLKDYDFDKMTYNVVTSPDIGSGADANVDNGEYIIPVSGLDSGTTYTWTVTVSDGTETVEDTFTFTTEMVAPVISNPVPADGERDVPMDIQELRFTLKDFQGDAMDFTVQTQPNIGSAQGTDVPDGTYTVPVSGMVYAATYRWYVNVTDGVHWTRKVFSFETGYPAQFNPFDYGWQYRKQITIDHTQVTGGLVNFPLLISTTDPDLIKAQTDGDDLLLMDSTGAAIKLRHEIEVFNQAAGVLVAWVNVPSLSSVEDTVLYMYYGNPDCINQQYPEKTWDSYYAGVWHMNDVTSSTIADSTLNDNNGVKIESNGPMQSIGKIGYGQVFDGNNDYINGGHDSSLSLTGAITLESWIYYSGVSNPIYPPDAIGKSTTKTGYGIQVDTDSGTFLRAGTGAWYDSPRHPQSTDTWYHVVGVYDGSYLRLYINGAEISPATSYTKGFTANSADALMGKHYDNTGFINGRLDEIRISNVIRTSTWISTEYANHNNPDGFLSIGPEESGP